MLLFSKTNAILPIKEIVIMKLSKLFSKLSYTPPERAVYAQIVAKARQPWLYLNAGVPDTVTGRFDMITLHSFIVMEHLSKKGEKESQFNQLLFDEVFLDMDHSLREMGVSDVAVSKKIRKMSEIFYGACNGYRTALEEPDPAKAFTRALQRNILGKEAAPEKLNNLVNYTLQAIGQVEKVPVKSILAGKMDWPDLELED